MALEKTILSRSGVEMNYWKIDSWKIDLPRKMMDITLVPYISSEARVEGLEPLNEERRTIRIFDRVNRAKPEESVLDYTNHFSPEALEKADQDIYKLMYAYIRDHVDEFQDAEDNV